MGSTSNKSTRKYSKRHLKKELAQRKKSRFVSKQRAERKAKLLRAVHSASEQEKQRAAQETSEQNARLENDAFLQKTVESEDDASELQEIVESDSEENRIGDVNSVQGPTGVSKESLAEQASSSDGEVEDQIAAYQQQLSDLQKQDPEFYAYLKEADEDLLKFNPASEEDTAAVTSAEGVGRELTLEQLESWCANLLSSAPLLQSLRCLMTAYAFACCYGGEGEKEEGPVQSLLQFKGSDVYSSVMLFALKEGDGIFRSFLGLKQRKAREKDISKAMKEHHDVTLQLQRFFSSTSRLLEQSLESQILAFVLRQLRTSVALMTGMPVRVQKLFLRSALRIFASSSAAPRLQAVLLLREMLLHLGDNAANLCLKGVYKSFLTACSRVSRETLPQVHFMGTCVIELYSLAPADLAYQNAFKFVKDLAVDLREVIICKDKEAGQRVFSWRYVNGLELWARLVGSLGDMQQLIYPVAQLLTGTARYQDQMCYLPLRLRLISAANRLSEATGVFIPVSSLLAGILSWSNLHKRPTVMGNEKCPNLALCLSVDEKTLKNCSFQSEVLEQILELMTEHLAPLSHTIAFPETSHWIALQLKKSAKGIQFPSYKSGIMQLVTAIRESAEKVLARRMHVAFSPRDIDQVEQFNQDGKASGESPLEVLRSTLRERRQQRQSLHASEVVTVKEKPRPQAAQKEKAEVKKAVTLSDAESLTSDEGELTEAELKAPPIDLFRVEDRLEDYALSEEEAETHPGSKRQKIEVDKSLPKQKRRKERRKATRKNKTKN